MEEERDLRSYDQFRSQLQDGGSQANLFRWVASEIKDTQDVVLVSGVGFSRKRCQGVRQPV